MESVVMFEIQKHANPSYWIRKYTMYLQHFGMDFEAFKFTYFLRPHMCDINGWKINGGTGGEEWFWGSYGRTQRLFLPTEGVGTWLV